MANKLLKHGLFWLGLAYPTILSFYSLGNPTKLEGYIPYIIIVSGILLIIDKYVLRKKK